MSADAAGGAAARKELWRRRIALIVAVLAPLIIAAVALLLLQQIQTGNELRKAEKEAVERRAVLQAVLSAHQDIETGTRGFVITGDEHYLEPFHNGVADLRRLWPVLAGMSAANPAERKLLDRLHTESLAKQKISQHTVDLRRAGDKAAAEDNVATGQGKVVMDRIRVIMARLASLQQARLTAGAQRTEGAIVRLRSIMTTLLAVLTVLLICAWRAMQNLLHLRDAALAAVEDLSLRREAILDSVTDGIVTLNPSGSIESANPATLRMFGYTGKDLDRRDVGVLFADQPPIGAVAQRLRELDAAGTGASASREIMGRCADGRVFPTEVAVSAMRLNQGMRYVAVIRDVTERKRVEQLKAEFVSTVSHELRTPLTSIAGALGLLAGGAAGALDARASRLIGIAHSNADRLVRLINDILDIEKIESGKMRFDNRELDLKAAVAASIEENRSYAAKFDVRIALSAPMQPMLVCADKDRLAQVLTNLISNAAKFSPRGGTVEVSIVQQERFYRVTVADSGPGIPEEFRKRIFGKFAQADASNTREKGGTGLGLSIVAEIMERLGGRVSFDSEPGEGSRFHIDLPVTEPKAAAKPARKRKPALIADWMRKPVDIEQLVEKVGTASALAETERPRVLHVEDDPDVVRLVAEALDGRAEVVAAEGVRSARAALAAMRFDLAIVDLGLADGCGIDILPDLDGRDGTAPVPVVVFSAQDADGDTAGRVAAYLTKARTPIGALVSAVETLTSSAKGGRAA